MFKKIVIYLSMLMLSVSVFALNPITELLNSGMKTITLEEIEGEDYEILETGEDYWIVEVDGVTYLVVF